VIVVVLALLLWGRLACCSGWFLVAMDVTLACTGPVFCAGALDPICPSVAAGPGLAAAGGLIRSLSAPSVWGVTHHSLALRGSDAQAEHRQY